jgi:hypothetical protein
MFKFTAKSKLEYTLYLAAGNERNFPVSREHAFGSTEISIIKGTRNKLELYYELRHCAMEMKDFHTQ